jgi:hypothetical protein
MDEKRKPTGTRGSSGRYELRVKGHLGARWADWFDGLALTHEADGSTAIRGTVIDQAALHGLLQKLRDLGLPLISVTELELGDAEQGPSRDIDASK